MSWRLEVIPENGERSVYESVRLEMALYASQVGAIALPHLLALGKSDETLRALRLNISGMHPNFTETGFTVEGSEATLHEGRDSIRADKVMSTGVSKELWALTVVTPTPPEA